MVTRMNDLQKQLVYTPKCVWDVLPENRKNDADIFCHGYKCFLNQAKTEREAAACIADMLISAGFISLDVCLSSGKPVKPGTRIYQIFKNKVVAAAVIGHANLCDGVSIIASHIDSPKLDLKQNPLYEMDGLAFMDTHYYGGIKKYQWTTVPLAMHGVIVKRNGDIVQIEFGENDEDPIFHISDLAAHLSQEQLQKKLSEAITGENLDVIVGSIPIACEQEINNKVKLGILKILYDQYGLEEEDFISAELVFVPAGKARDVGFDRGLIASYGHDDRVCAYTSLKALMDLSIPKKTAVVFFMDKEEIGSMGNTGMQSSYMNNFLSDIIDCCTVTSHAKIDLRHILSSSLALSADGVPAFDPVHAEVADKKNTAYLGNGVVIIKYYGNAGKSGTNDANAEYVGKIRKLFNDNGIIWQYGELGKVDQGGGASMSMFIANHGVEIIDCGPSILSLHAPVEIVSKADVYMTYKAYRIFFS